MPWNASPSAPGASPARQALVHQLADRVPRPADGGFTRVAVDGVDGAGKTVLAAELAAVLAAAGRPVLHVSVDYFHHVAARRYARGRQSPEGFWLDSYDYNRLRSDLLDPLGPGGSGRYRRRSHDLATDRLVDDCWEQAAPGTVLVVDGIFLHRDELHGTWDLSVYLRAGFTTTYARMAARDGCDPDPDHPANRRYRRGQQLYLDHCRPWERADVVIDTDDLAAPYLVA